MALSLPKALGLIPSFVVAVESVIEGVAKIKALPVKDAKSVGTTLGVANGTTLYLLLDLADDVIAAAGG